MPRFVTITVGCDMPDCDVTAEEGEGTVAPMTLSIDGKQGREFLICKTHRDGLDEILQPLMSAGVKVETSTSKKSGGRRSSGSSAAAGAGTSPGTSTDDASSATQSGKGGTRGVQRFECQEPGCGRILHNRTGMAQHVIRSHGYENLAAYEERYPQEPDNHE